MCGIVGYIGPKRVVPLILDGLKRLEYRGYDSAGIAVVGDNGKLEIRRAPGKLRNLEESIRTTPLEGVYGIGHTRWATHGRPTEENAHPHRDCTGEIVVVHNGIIENYIELKKNLIAEGHKFITETDTEIIAHLIEKFSKDCPARGSGAQGREGDDRRLRAGGRFREGPEQDRRGAPGTADRRGFGRTRILRRERHPGDPRAHAQHFFPRRRRNGHAHAAGRPAQRFRRPPDHAPAPAHHLGPDHGGKGRLQAFHAEGNLRAAARRPRHAARQDFAGNRKSLPRRNGHHRGGIPQFPRRENRRLRHELARRARRQVHDRAAGADSGRGGLRQRVPLSRSDRRQAQPDHRHQPVRRDGRHAGRRARSPPEGREGAGDLQRGRLDAHARIERHDLHARRPGNRRRFDEGFHRPAHGAAADGAVSRAGARKARECRIRRS